MTRHGSIKNERLKTNVANLRRLIAGCKVKPGYDANEAIKRSITELEAVCARFELALNFTLIN
jgi:hypothetical protein